MVKLFYHNNQIQMFSSKERSRSPHQPKGKEPKLPLLSKHSSQQFAGGCIEVFCRIKPENEPHGNSINI